MGKTHVERTHLPPQVVAEQLGVAVESILAFIRRGELRAINVGKGRKNAWRIAKTDLREFLDSRSTTREVVSR